ncbi:MAG: GNAT family N-acetyltransferase [Deltaproteobacteria bacterium]|nr:GNAT family N-acetyltransferase [Deltaproteobacteria bacterium]
MDIKIRPYQDTDYKQLRRLLVESDLYYEKIDSKERISNKVGNDKNSVLVAFDGKKLIGSVFILDDRGWLSFVFHLAVAQAYRGMGIGSRLLSEAEKLIKSRGGHEVYLLIDTENIEVAEFYKKNGYKESGLYRWMGKDINPETGNP